MYDREIPAPKLSSYKLSRLGTTSHKQMPAVSLVLDGPLNGVAAECSALISFCAICLGSLRLSRLRQIGQTGLEYSKGFRCLAS